MNKINKNLTKDISSIIHIYLLPSIIQSKIYFNNNIELLKNTRNLLYIETLNNNLNPLFFRKHYININGTNITYNNDLFDTYLLKTIKEFIICNCK